jgi:hypothetical protein
MYVLPAIPFTVPLNPTIIKPCWKQSKNTADINENAVSMDSMNDFSREQFLNIAKASGLSPEGSYQDKLFEYVRNMLNRNKLLYDIDVSDVEPMSIIAYFRSNKK